MDPKLRQFPGLLRSDLDFGASTQFKINLVALSNTAGTIYMSVLTKSGVMSFEMSVTGNGSYQAKSFAITDIPISVAIFGGSTYDSRGMCYVIAELMINNDAFGALCSGYVIQDTDLVYPNGLIETPVSGRGHFVSVLGTDPAAGAEIGDNMPNTEIVKLHAITFNLVTSATVANRAVTFMISGLNGTIARIPTTVVQTAGQTVKYTFGIGLDYTFNTTSLIATAPLPADILLDQNCDIFTTTTGIQAGDNFSQPMITYEKWIDPQM